jgi:hypothetical protein
MVAVIGALMADSYVAIERRALTLSVLIEQAESDGLRA